MIRRGTSNPEGGPPKVRHPTFLVRRTSRSSALPRRLRGDDVRDPDALGRYLLRRFSERGDIVLDPFAGFGTILTLSEGMGRIPYGVERSADRAHYARSRLEAPSHLVEGDARDLASFGFPKFDLCMTSPPYLTRDDPRNPLSRRGQGGYEQYLRDLVQIFREVRRAGKPGSRIVVEVTNLRIDASNRASGSVTLLAWDAAYRLSKLFEFEGEIVVGWKGPPAYHHGGTYGYGYDHSYCLVFRRGSE